MKEITIRHGKKGWNVILDRQEHEFEVFKPTEEIELLEYVGKLVFEGQKVNVTRR
jgi:hypothetical protein